MQSKLNVFLNRLNIFIIKSFSIMKTKYTPAPQIRKILGLQEILLKAGKI